MYLIHLFVNGKSRDVDVSPSVPLPWVLSDTLAPTGTKYGCGMGLCDASAVHLNGEAVRSCQTPVGAAGTKKVTAIEGLSTDRSHPARGVEAAQESEPVVSHCPLRPHYHYPVYIDAETAQNRANARVAISM